ncbi:putative alcohol dehydrogenase [Aspergillus nomiae NRRL 13137]|uniref:Putative alcohol dehydrogenase n=1 Tax=Aspergillus nomiae NRRL (strain ATCC 15546 / NRRL 13137 / CBS 260.88 / M93) TaxID=1509407 RepID=A0A0L1JCT5_ASPN3|nr:putative alcohol dehydrogenase [Aspergillus nomiae NRRL 13137]KNG89589.1 putative alcohol dehydrogenase [Aspergillus nomiae NRRL 13137]
MLNTTLDTGTVRATLKTTRLMEAVRFHGPRDIRVETIDEPICGKGEVKIRPAFVGLCGSDIHEYTGGPVLIPQEPHNITGRSCPVTLGHEISGIVEEVGEGVAHVSPGQRVVVRPTIFDRQCPACKRGYEYCCENIGFIGLSGYGGGLAKYHVAPAEHFYPIPDNVSLEAAALIEPLAVAWHAVNLSPFKIGDNVMVVGGGPVGIGIVQVLKLQGAKNIMLSELYDKRRRFAIEYGATHAFDPGQEDVTQRVMEVTDSVGADVIFDAAGVEKALNGAISACRTHGAIINVAVWEKKPAISVNDLMYNEVKYTGSALYDEGSFAAVIKALGYGQLQPEKMITSKIKLNETVEKGFETLVNDREDHCKILIDVQA